MVSNRLHGRVWPVVGAIGLLFGALRRSERRTLVRFVPVGFELGWWHVVAVAVKPFVVEPVHPGEGGQLEFVDVVPAAGIGTVDALGLVQPVGRFGERVVEAVCHGAGRGAGADLVEAFGEAYRGELLPASEWVTRPMGRRAPRERRAISNASRTISVRMLAATRQPTMRRLNRSRITTR